MRHTPSSEMGSDVQVRSYRPDDDAAIAAIVRANADSQAWKKLEDRFLVAMRDSRPVGYASFSLDSENGIGRVDHNAVDPALGGRGIGTILHRHVLGKRGWPRKPRLHGLKTLVFKSRIGLKCFTLLVHRTTPCSAAVAATRESRAAKPHRAFTGRS